MPWTKAQHALFAMCSTRKGRSRARVKCPSVKASKRMMREGVKRGKKRRKKH